MVTHSHFDTLGITAASSVIDIKKAYRRLSLIHHPDKGGDNSTFQKINDAYQILSNEDSRNEYLENGDDEPEGRGGGSKRGHPMDDMFAQMFGGGQQRQRTKPKQQSKPSKCEISVTLEELFRGSSRKMDIERERICKGCTGTGAKPNTKRRQCYQCQGDGIAYATRAMGGYLSRVPVKCVNCKGTGSKIRPQDFCKKCRGGRVQKEKKRVEVFIEKGSHPDTVIILRDEGDESPESSSPGNLEVSLSLQPHATFSLLPPSRSSANDLSTTISLTLSEALLGFNRLILIHLDGRGIRVEETGPYKDGELVRIRGEGMQKSNGETGDLICLIEVEKVGGWVGEQTDRLISLMPPKRQDIENPNETDEVILEKMTFNNNLTFSNIHHAGQKPRTQADVDQEEAEYGMGMGAEEMGCQQQ